MILHNGINLNGGSDGGSSPEFTPGNDSLTVSTGKVAGSDLSAIRGYLTHLVAQANAGVSIHHQDVATLLTSLKRDGLEGTTPADRTTRESVLSIVTALVEKVLPAIDPHHQDSVRERISELSNDPYWKQLMVHLGVGSELQGPNRFRERSADYDPYDDLREIVLMIKEGTWIIIPGQVGALMRNHPDQVAMLAYDGTREALEHIRGILRVSGNGFEDAFDLVARALEEAGPEHF